MLSLLLAIEPILPRGEAGGHGMRDRIAIVIAQSSYKLGSNHGPKTVNKCRQRSRRRVRHAAKFSLTNRAREGLDIIMSGRGAHRHHRIRHVHICHTNVP